MSFVSHSNFVSHLDSRLLKKLKRNDSDIYVYSRTSTILPYMVGKSFFIYNGKTFSKLYVLDNSFCSHRIGEFSFTRKIVYEKKGKKVKKNFKK